SGRWAALLAAAPQGQNAIGGRPEPRTGLPTSLRRSSEERAERIVIGAGDQATTIVPRPIMSAQNAKAANLSVTWLSLGLGFRALGASPPALDLGGLDHKRLGPATGEPLP